MADRSLQFAMDSQTCDGIWPIGSAIRGVLVEIFLLAIWAEKLSFKR
jgi:hypothetical protein